jgi:predicted Zn-dependent protease
MTRGGWWLAVLLLAWRPAGAQPAPSATPLKQLAAAAAAKPGDARLQFRLGRAYEQAGDLQAATRAYFRAHLASPGDARTLITLARTYARIPLYDRAAYWYRKLLWLRPGDEKFTLEAARLALSNDQPLQAELLLKQTLERHPDALEAWLLLGQTYESLKLSREAVQCYERVAQLRPPSPVERRRLIELYLSTDQAAKALPQIQAALRQAPADTELLVLLGDVHRGLRNPAAAAAAYEQAAATAPQDPGLRLKLAEALAEAGDERAALREYERACALGQPSADLLLKVAALAARYGEDATSQHYLALLVALEPRVVEHRQALTRTALARGDQATALGQYRELQHTGDAVSYLSEAEFAERLGGRDWALGRLREMRPLLAGKPALAGRVALLLAALGETGEAAGVATQALAEASATADDRALAARALLEAGEVDRSERALRGVLAADPRNAAAILGLARALQLRERWAESYDLLRGGLAVNADNAELALALLGAASRAKQLGALAALLRRMVEGEPRNEVVLRALADAYRALGGAARSATELAAMSAARPSEKLWVLVAARELGAAGRVAEAAARYEGLARDPTLGPEARAGLCDTLLAGQRHAQLLATIRRLADPAQMPAEAYGLLTEPAGPAQLQTVSPTDSLERIARAAAALYLAPPNTEAYYLALADTCLATRSAEPGVGWLQQKTLAAGQAAPTTAGLLRL